MEMEQGHYALRSRSRSSSRTPLIQSPAVIEQEVSNHHYKLRIYERRNSHSPEDISHREKSDYKFLIGSGNKTIKQSLKTIVENKKEIITEESFLKDENQKTWDSFPSTRNVDYPYKDQNTRQFTLVNGKLEDQSSILGYQTAKSIKEISPCRTLTNDYTSIEGQHKHISNMHSYAGSYRQYETNTSRMWRNLDHILQFVYLFMVRVLLFDAWLLSRVSHLRRWIYQRSPKLLWVAFLPLLAFVGYWSVLYFSTLFMQSEDITQLSKNSQISIASVKPSFLSSETFDKEENFASIIDKLSGRTGSLENRSVIQYDHLSNINPKVTHLQDNKQVWSKYTNEILLLGKELADHKLCEICIREIDVLKSQFERLTEFYSKLKSCCDAHTNNPTKEELEKRIRLILMDHVGAQTLKKEELKVQKDQSLADENMGITDQRVREIVRHAIQIYDADKTGRVDYALESAGGQIISTRCTQRYDIRTRAYKLLAFTLYHENNNPRIVIQGNPIQPGVCWAFQGFPGYLLIKLRSSVYVTGFTVEHVPKSIVSSEEMKSAPKKFNVWGFLDENDLEPIMFGDYEFVISDDNLQYFPVQNRAIKVPYEYVELRVHSNHGQLEYTSLYRFRVHGKPVSVIHE